MVSTRIIVAISCCLLFTACSSSSRTAPSGSTSSSGPSGSTSSSGPAGSTSSSGPAGTPSVAESAGAAKTYVAEINQLCDALLPKVLAAIHGGHDSTYPIAVYRSEVKVTDKLEAEFDRQVAAIAVPPAATQAHAALQAYVSFANGINAKRAAAAARGQAAFDREITAENAEDPNDPVIANRTAQGFAESCNAR